MPARRSLLVASYAVLLAACGARTGQDVPPFDAGQPLPPVHVTLPTPEVTTGCADAGATSIYVVTQQMVLMSFDPAAGTFTRIGFLSCPVSINADTQPFSMAVDRSGIAYVVYRDGELFRVSTATAACQSTSWRPDPRRFSTTFGMGYARNDVDGGEVLYVASDDDGGARLASLDTNSFTLHPIGAFDRAVTAPELTGTGAGDLFAFYNMDGGSAIAQIDKSTAQSTAQSMLPGVDQGSAWAFAVWGGDFYTFTAPGLNSVVTRFRPSDGSIVQVAQLSDLIVGAGVSTCAPQK